ncbi:MAG: GH116 family glycosyl-hydrolase [Marinilabiliales bacterium]|nr:GH116 family glycosyl-hydrolase [Marinilabiliales bacterium]
MKSPARSFARALLIGVVALIPAVMIARPASSGDNGPAAQAAGRDELFRPGAVRTFEGRALAEVAFPLGGIGTGTVSLGGRGNLRDWEIFNRPGKGVHMPFTFFALYVEQGGTKRVRVLEGPLEPPFTTGFGFRRVYVPGLPRMEKARFKGEYPFAEVALSDKEIPLEITLEAFNPFIPLEADDSGIPAFVLRYRVKNTGMAPAKITIAGSVVNPIGYDGVGTVDGLGHDKFGQNLNEIKATPSLRGLAMSSRKVKPEEAAFGTMALTTPWPETTTLAHWVRGEWWDDLQIFWDDFAADGLLKDVAEPSPSPDKQTDVGTLGLVATVEPGQEVVLPFILSWNFPNVLNYFDIVPEQRGRIFKNRYAGKYPDAWAAAEYLQANLGPSRGLEPGLPRRLLLLDPAALRPRRRVEPGRHHPDDDRPLARGRELLRLRGLRRPVGLLPAQLRPRLELRPVAGLPLPGARADHARDRLPDERQARRGHGLPHVAAARQRRPLGLQAGRRRPDGPHHQPLPRLADLGRHGLAQEALAAGEKGPRVRLDPVGRRPRRADGGRAAQHLRHRVLRPEQHDGRVLSRRAQGRRGHGLRRRRRRRGQEVPGHVRQGPGRLRRLALERRVLRPEVRPGHGEEVPVRRGLPLRHAPRPVAGHGLGPRPLPAGRAHPVLARVDLQVQFPDGFPELLQRPADLRPQRRAGPPALLLAQGRPAAAALSLFGRGLDRDRVPGRLAPHLRRPRRGGAERRQGRPRPLRRPAAQSLERGRMRPPLRPGDVVLGRPDGPLRILLFSARKEHGFRPEGERGGFPDGLDGRLRLGDLRPERGTGPGPVAPARGRGRIGRAQRYRGHAAGRGGGESPPFGQGQPGRRGDHFDHPADGEFRPHPVAEAGPRRAWPAAGAGDPLLIG